MKAILNRKTLIIGLAFLGLCLSQGCLHTEIIPSLSDDVNLKISDVSDPEHPATVNVRDQTSIREIRNAINRTRPTITKFRVRFQLEFSDGSVVQSIGVNGMCVIKDGNAFCGTQDIEETARRIFVAETR